MPVNRSRNPFRIDPTRTAPLRRQMQEILSRRFDQISHDILLYLPTVVENAQTNNHNQIVYDLALNVMEGNPTFADLSSDKNGMEDVLTDNRGYVRDRIGRFAATAGHAVVSGVVPAVIAGGAKIGHIEHAAKEWVTDKVAASVSKLPGPMQKAVTATYYVGRAGTQAAFVSWTVGQKLAERVSHERGASPEESRRLRGVLASMDVALLKPVQLGLHATGAHATTLGIASFVPPATAGYLLYSTARNPRATYRAAKGLVKDAATSTVDSAKSVKKGFGSRVASWWSAVKGIGQKKGTYYENGKLRMSVPSVSNNATTIIASVPVGNSEKDNASLIADIIFDQKYGSLKGQIDWRCAVFAAALQQTQDGASAIVLATRLLGDHPTPPKELSEGNETTPTDNSNFDQISNVTDTVRDWLRYRLSFREGLCNGSLWNKYVHRGYMKGVTNAYMRTAPQKEGESDERYKGRMEGFISNLERNSLTTNSRVALDQITGITGEMGAILIKIVERGVERGIKPEAVANQLKKQLSISRDKALAIARTEMVRVVAEGALDTMQALGVDQVKANVEYHTSGQPCPKCASLMGKVFTVNSARGIIPRHTYCKCAWVSAVGRKANARSFYAGKHDVTDNAGANCGIGSRGFQRGNKCAKGSKGKNSKNSDDDELSGSGTVSMSHYTLHLNKPHSGQSDIDHTVSYLDKYAVQNGKDQAHGMHTDEPSHELTVDGIRMRWPSTADGKDAAAKTLLNLSRSTAPQSLKSATREIIHTSQDNKRDEEFATTYGMPGFKSSATGGDGRIVVYSGRSLDAKTFAHESGHNFADKTWGSTTPSSVSKYGRAQEMERPVTEYGRTNHSEDFAEAAMMYSHPVQRQELEMGWPKKYAALKELLGE